MSELRLVDIERGEQIGQHKQSLYCRIFGCHVPKRNCRTTYRQSDMMILIQNRCSRCNKEYTCEIPYEDFFLDIDNIDLPEVVGGLFHRK